MLMHRPCTERHAGTYNRAKPIHGPVRRNTLSVVAAAPATKRGFAMPDFHGLVRLHRLRVLGHGGAKGQPAPHDYGRVSNRHVPPDARRNADGGFLATPVGAKKTMHPATQGRTAPAIQPHQVDTIQLHAQAINGLHAALHTLMHGELNQPALARAIGKATRAATAIKRLAALQPLEG